jgi:hypothetical protein
MNNAQLYYLLRRGVFHSGIGSVVADFRLRVISDSGVFESQKCVNQAVASLKQTI